MRGTNERRSIVDEDGWEPIRPQRGQLVPLLVGFAAAFVLIPTAVFFATYLLLSR